MILNKPLLYQIYMISCALVLLINSYEITFLFWGFAALITTRRVYSVSFLKLLLIPALIIIIGLISSFFQTFTLYNFIRDFTYLLKPILGLLIGYNFCKILGKKHILNTIIAAGVALAVIHMAVLAYHVVFSGIHNFNMLRLKGGYFDDLEVYVLIMLLFRKELELSLSKKWANWMILLVTVSLIFYFARTNILQFIILYVAMKGYFRATPKTITVFTTVVLTSLIGYWIIYQSNPIREGEGLNAFLYKVKNAPIEAFKTTIDEDDWKEFHDNYRSFENIITVRQVSAQGWPTIIIGKGIGSQIDLKRKIWTNDLEYIRYIPTLHNAFATIFLKSGLLGVALMLYFIYLLYKHPKHYKNPQIRYLNYLLVGSAIYLVLSNWVFMGLYLKLDNKSIILGALWAYRELLMKEENARISAENQPQIL